MNESNTASFYGDNDNWRFCLLINGWPMKQSNLDGTLKCPICKKLAEKDKTKNPFLPFCSDRCRTIDLGKWLDGKYVIEGDEPTHDAES